MRQIVLGSTICLLVFEHFGISHRYQKWLEDRTTLYKYLVLIEA